jgi:hypothetical protein
MRNNKAPDWLTEAVLTVRKALKSNVRTARLVATLLTIVLMLVAATWTYHEITAADQCTQMSINVTNR